MAEMSPEQVVEWTANNLSVEGAEPPCDEAACLLAWARSSPSAHLDFTRGLYSRLLPPRGTAETDDGDRPLLKLIEKKIREAG